MDTEKIAIRLTELRKEKGWTQQELAEKLNVSNKLISKWENGGAIPDVSYLQKYSELFGITIDRLVDNTTNLYNAIDYDKIKIDKKVKKTKYIIPIIWSIVFILYIIGVFIWVFFAPNEEFPIWGKILIAVFPSLIILATIGVTIQRIKEIKGGDENDSSKY